MTPALIERLEKAEEGSRELDAEIWRVVFCRVDADGKLWYRDSKLGDLPTIPEDAPDYTASVDDALTLVPEGWCGRVWFGNVPKHIAQNESGAVVWSPDTQKRESFFGPSGNGKSAALSICIAALRARAA